MKDRFKLKTATVTKTNANTILVKTPTGPDIAFSSIRETERVVQFKQADTRTPPSDPTHQKCLLLVPNGVEIFNDGGTVLKPPAKLFIYFSFYLDCFFFLRTSFFCDCCTKNSAKGCFFLSLIGNSISLLNIS